MELTNNFNLPEPLVKAVENNSYSAGSGDISVTTLLEPPQITELTKRHKDNLTTDAADQIFSLFGQVTHGILERAGTTGIMEERLYVERLGWKIGGQFDYIDEDGLLWDWKTVSVFELKDGLKPSKEQQINIYAYMARKNGYSVNGLRLAFLFRDWRSGERYNPPFPNYPPLQVLVYPVRMWDEEETERFLDERIRLHQSAAGLPDAELPECSPEERWVRPGKQWAVERDGYERAIRLFDDEQSGLDYIKQRNLTDARVTKREGLSARCKNYCRVREVCAQYARATDAT